MRIFYIIIFLFLKISYLYGNSSYYLEGVTHFEKQEFSKARFKFEQDIVFNPKSEISYLYLSKILGNLKTLQFLEMKFF